MTRIQESNQGLLDVETLFLLTSQWPAEINRLLVKWKIQVRFKDPGHFLLSEQLIIQYFTEFFETDTVEGKYFPTVNVYVCLFVYLFINK